MPLAKPKNQMQSSGDLRRFLSHIATGVSHGDIKPTEAIVAIKACEQICVSLYSEIKYAALIAAAGKPAIPLGELPLYETSNE